MVSKMVSSGLKRTVVPWLSDSPMYWSSSCGTPRLYTCFQRFPSRRTVTSRRSESALTQETPTPCRPPDTL